MKAAINFKFGDGEKDLHFKAGDVVPDSVASQVPDHCILEKVAQQDPDRLSRAQLVMLANLGNESPDELEPMVYNEDELREALGEEVLATKADIVEWFSQVRPDQDVLDKDRQSRVEMVDLIVDELIGE